MLENSWYQPSLFTLDNPHGRGNKATTLLQHSSLPPSFPSFHNTPRQADLTFVFVFLFFPLSPYRLCHWPPFHRLLSLWLVQPRYLQVVNVLVVRDVESLKLCYCSMILWASNDKPTPLIPKPDPAATSSAQEYRYLSRIYVSAACVLMGQTGKQAG